MAFFFFFTSEIAFAKLRILRTRSSAGNCDKKSPRSAVSFFAVASFREPLASLRFMKSIVRCVGQNSKTADIH